jgi:hypothetical protein
LSVASPVQAPGPHAGPKYCDHLPLYRQSQIYAREGIDLDRSTLADWVGGASALLEPLVRAIGRYALGAYVERVVNTVSVTK